VRIFVTGGAGFTDSRGRAGWDMVEPVADRKGHNRRYSLDVTKAAAELGYAPAVPFSDGLAKTIRWYAENRAWWEPLKARAAL
jgi:dTDP-glucose 4,6-dehydratase